MPTLSESELVTLRHRQPARVEWFLAVAPFGDPLCTARVNDAGIDRGAMTIAFDGAAGDCGAIEPGMTLWVGTTGSSYGLGSVRIRWATGSHFGVAENDEILWEDDLHLTVPGEAGFREPWSVFPRMVEAGGAVTFYKDYDIPYTNQGDHLPPKANAGPPAIAFIDPITGLASLDWVGQISYATEAAGDPLVSWAWQFPDGTPPTSALEGTVAAPISVTWNTPGFRYVKLVVADSLGTTGTTHVPVWIFDESSPTVPWTKVEVTSQDGSLEGGWKARLKVWNAGPADFPEKSLVVLGVRTWYRGVRREIGGWPDRENIRFVGWVNRETLTYDATVGTVEFEAVGLSAVMEQLPAFTVYLEEEGSPNEWHEMVDNNADRISHHVLEFNTTINQIANVTCPREGNTRKIEARGFPDASPFTQLQDNLWEDTKSRMTSDRQGVLHITRDPQMMVAVDRATVDVVCTLTDQDWMDTIGVPAPHVPELGFVELGGFGYGTPYLSQAPGAAPLQQERDNRIDGCILDTGDPQGNANWWSGLALTKANVTYPDLSVTLKGCWPVFEPALQEYVRLDFEDPDGRHPFDGERFIVRGVSFQDKPAMGTTTTSLVLESENVLLQGETVDIPVPPPPEPPEPPPPPIPPPSELWDGPIKACVAWTHDQLGYTNNLLLHHVSSTSTIGTGHPDLYDTAVDFEDVGVAVGDVVENLTDHSITTVATIASANHLTLTANIGLVNGTPYHICGAQWTDIISGLSGTILQFIYVQTGVSTVGGWVLTSAGAYWASNVFSTAPAWSCKLTLAQMRIDTADPDAQFRGIHGLISNPAFVAVHLYQPAFEPHPIWPAPPFTGGVATTLDTGGAWNYASMPQPPPAGHPNENHCAICGTYSIEISQSSGKIWVVRGYCVQVSTDGGASFAYAANYFGSFVVGHTAAWWGQVRNDLYSPEDGTVYFAGERNGSGPACISKSEDSGEIFVSMVAAGYTLEDEHGVNGWYGNTDDVIAGWVADDDNHHVLLRSSNGGGDWSEIGDQDTVFGWAGAIIIPETWPPSSDTLVWVCRQSGVPASKRIFYTDNNGTLWCNKMGNWFAIFADWGGTSGGGGGMGNVGCIPLPRVGSNS